MKDDSYTMTASETQKKSININDFDPVFRKAEFQTVRQGALEMIDFQKLNGKFNE